MSNYRKQRSGVIERVIAALLALAVLAGGVCACGYASRNDDGVWFSNSDFSSWHWADKQAEPDDTSEDNISLATYSLDAADYEAYGISPRALEAKVITVNFNPVNTTNRRIGWIYGWKDAQSEWASGKNINDYVDFVPAPNFGASATLSVKQPFGEPVVVTATSRANSQLTSSSQFEYVARYDQLWGDGDLVLDEYGQSIDVFKDLYIIDPYTVLPTECVAKVSFTLNNAMANYFRENRSDCDLNQDIEFTNVTSAISWDDFIAAFNTFYEDLAAQYCVNVVDDEFGVITVEMMCKYTDSFGGEVVYTFTDSETVFFSQEFIKAMSTPPTSIETTPGGGAF